MPLRHFLLIYDHAQQKLLEARDLGPKGDAAARTYSEVEETYKDRDGIEIVLVGADSLTTIQRTHAHYFDNAEAGLFPELAGSP